MRDGRLGSIVAMVAQHTTSTAQFVALDNWRTAPEEAPGGAFTATGVHSLDHMIEFAGRVREVRCVDRAQLSGPLRRHDDGHAAIRERRVRADFLLGCDRHQFRIHALWHRGLGEISRPDLSRLRFVPASTAAPTGPVQAPPDEILQFSGFDTLRAELTAFARAIREGEPYPVPIEEVAARHGGIRRHRAIGATRRTIVAVAE